MITLCEKCFPNWAEYEIYSMIPLGPCAECGKYDDHKKGGLRCNLFPRDPRPINPESKE